MSGTSLFILTGTLRDLGATLTQALIQPGHRLVCIARGDNAELRARAAAADVMLDWHQVDLSDAHAAEAWITKALVTLPAFAKMTPVLNADAVEPIDTVDTLRADTLLPHLRLNLASPIALTVALLHGTASWSAQRRVLTISSGATRRPITDWAAYCTGKTGLDMFVRTINADGDASVRAVTLAPDVIDTDIQRTIHGADFAGVQRFRDPHAHSELVSPQDAAACIAAYLIRPDFGVTELDDLRNIA